MGGDVVQIVLNGSVDGPDDALNERAEGFVRQQRYVDAVSRADGGIAITVKNGSAAVPNLVSLLHDNQVPVTSLTVARPTLDDVFLKYTGRTIRAEEATGDEVGEMMRPMMGLKKR